MHAGARFFCASFAPCTGTHDLCSTRSCKKQGSAPSRPSPLQNMAVHSKCWSWKAGQVVVGISKLKNDTYSSKEYSIMHGCILRWYRDTLNCCKPKQVAHWLLFLVYCWFANQIIASSHPLYWTTYPMAWNNTTNAKADRQRRGVGEATVPRRGTKPSWLQHYSYWCIKSLVVSLWHYLDSILAKTLNWHIFQEKDALQFQTVSDLVN